MPKICHLLDALLICCDRNFYAHLQMKCLNLRDTKKLAEFTQQQKHLILKYIYIKRDIITVSKNFRRKQNNTEFKFELSVWMR